MRKKIILIFAVLISIVIILTGVLGGYFAKSELKNREIIKKDFSEIDFGKNKEDIDDEFEKFILTFEKKPENYKKIIENLGGEILYDYNIIEGIAVKIPKDKIGLLNSIKNLKSIKKAYKFHILLSESVPQIRADGVQVQGVDGSGIRVAVLDTGIDYNHAYLSGLINSSNPDECYHFLNEGADHSVGCMDDHGHGTHVSGIIASQDSLYRGVSPGVDLMMGKISDSSGLAYDYDVIKALEWAVNNSADIVSFSFGGCVDPTENVKCNTGLPCNKHCGGEACLCDCYDTALSEAMDNAVDNGTSIFAASGNTGYYGYLNAPACADNVISVGAVDKGDVIAEFSSGGPDLDITAPGVDIISTWWTGYSGCLGDLECLAYASGTSMATPHAAGTAALMLEINPSLNTTEIREILRNTSVDLGLIGFDNYYGYGRIDAFEASGLPDFGYLESYLINPNTSMNVSQNEFFSFSSGVKCLGGPCGDVEGFLDPEQEISYDDGTAEEYLAYGWDGAGFAVRFSPLSYPTKLLKARFNVYNTTAFEIHIWNDNGAGGSPGSDLISPFIVNPNIYQDWYDVNLSSFNITITEGDFYIGWIELNNYNYLGVDKNGIADYRSWVYEPLLSSWYPLSSYSGYANSDLMIRAVIEVDKGIISTIPGAEPFYTIENPQNCLDMQINDSCEKTWLVNATGNINKSYNFFVIYKPENYEKFVDLSETGKVNLTITEKILKQFNISLETGWNLISLPLILINKTLPEPFLGISGNYSSIFAYNASDAIDPWKSYDPSRPSFLNDLKFVDERMGLWIKMINKSTLTNTGQETSLSFDIISGWNLDGYPSLTSQNVTNSLTGYSYASVFAYNASDAIDPWKSYDPTRPEFLNDLKMMGPGAGFWIKQ